MVSFWLENPNTLLNKNHITEIWPNSDFDLARKLNAITRLIIILTINLILYEQKNFTILFMNEYMLKDNYVLDKKNL